ncbi:hypothetical protein [Bacteroides pyogenes]|uniref:hypothetical protein n=1 Tax=Bacteroides pyogenes TaxID=310300 RepID=UPI003FA09146
MAETEIKTIALSKETAELLDCKKSLDEMYSKIGAIAAHMFGDGSEYDNRVNNAYVKANQIICDLLIENIDITSTDNQYKVI